MADSIATGAERTRQAILAYAEHHDESKLAEDAVFTVMGTGQEARGREAIGQLLAHFYRHAFTADFTARALVCDAAHAVLEGTFHGRHSGEFAGIAATGREVAVPLCVVYDLIDGRIVAGHIYFEMDVLRQQLGPR